VSHPGCESFRKLRSAGTGEKGEKWKPNTGQTGVGQRFVAAAFWGVSIAFFAPLQGVEFGS
jgi:hypothetical protein